MHSMEIDRRTFCRALGAGLLLPALSRFAHAETLPSVYAAAFRGPDGGYGAALLNASGEIARTVALPSRGHGFAAHVPTARIVAFARRPGRHAVAFSTSGEAPPVGFEPPAERHFYGHGAFSRDGRILFTTENEAETGNGLIGLYDSTDRFAPLGTFASGGIGPHELTLMPDGRTLAVANGGIRTDPALGREPLNIEQMRPSLAYIDTETGTLIERVTLPGDLHKLSLRHLAVNTRGLVVVGCQHKGPRNETPGLVFTHAMGEEPRELSLPGNIMRKLHNYVSSVALDRSGRYAAVTSSKGGAALILDTERRQLEEMHLAADISGIAASCNAPGLFIATSGNGRVGEPATMAEPQGPKVSWDNHLLRVA